MLTSNYFRVAAILFSAIVLFIYNNYVFANDLFIGKFASETQENFGPGKLGEIEVNVVRREDKYILSIFHNGEFKYEIEAIECNPEAEGYLVNHPMGDVYVLCSTKYKSSVFVYSQNGIKVPVVDKYYKTQSTYNGAFGGFAKFNDKCLNFYG